MKLILLIVTSVTLTNCAVDSKGNKTFLNRNASQWGDIGFNTGKKAATIAVEEYNNTASK